MDNQKYLQTYEKACKGDAEAMYRLGKMYEDEGSSENIWIARKFYHKAAKLGYPAAYFALGNIIAKNDSITLAADYWFLAAEKGCKAAMVRLGDLFHAEGMEEAADKYFLRASETSGEAAADSTTVCNV